MGKYLGISSYIRKPFLIYDFAKQVEGPAYRGQERMEESR
jgi:hypothetical protein